MLEIGWYLRHTNASCVDVQVQARHREECYEVLHLEPGWRVEAGDAADLPPGAARFIYRRIRVG